MRVAKTITNYRVNLAKFKQNMRIGFMKFERQLLASHTGVELERVIDDFVRIRDIFWQLLGVTPAQDVLSNGNDVSEKDSQSLISVSGNFDISFCFFD